MTAALNAWDEAPAPSYRAYRDEASRVRADLLIELFNVINAWENTGSLVIARASAAAVLGLADDLLALVEAAAEYQRECRGSGSV